MSSLDDLHVELGRQWSALAQLHQVDRFAELLADDFVMWYNFEGVNRSRAEFLQTLRNAHALFDDQAHLDERVLPTPQGFVLQATLTCTMDEQKVISPFCLIATVRNGKVVRGEEYFDTSQLPRRPAKNSTEMVSGHR